MLPVWLCTTINFILIKNIPLSQYDSVGANFYPYSTYICLLYVFNFLKGLFFYISIFNNYNYRSRLCLLRKIVNKVQVPFHQPHFYPNYLYIIYIFLYYTQNISITRIYDNLFNHSRLRST